MKILVLGGTVFAGRHLVEAAITAGHTVTMFNRGQTNPGLFPGVETIHGDRTVGLGALAGRRWDAAIDAAGYVPRVVRMSAEFLAAKVDHYTFVSSISVLASFRERGMDESAPVGRLQDASTEEVTGDAYGPLKALCEVAAETAMPGKTLIIRPGLIVGPDDPTDRFTYWPARIARGGEILAPVGPECETQLIDVRDLAEWTVRMIEAKGTGVFNATGPATPLTLGEVFETCRAASGSDAKPVWVTEEFVTELGILPWMELPLWVGGGDEMAGFAAVNCQKAIAAGITFRPLAETVVATLDWDRQRASLPRKAGLSPEKEAAALAMWHARQIEMEAL
ncbi:MAG: NAD-dependent epimerase/dehydratase family protein [Anaerolineaceae bacterium]